MTIWKFRIDVDVDVEVTMPDGARVLSVGIQYGKPCLWVLVDPSKPYTVRRFAWRGTGHQSDGVEDMTFLGTVQMHGGDLVLHLFEPMMRAN